MLRPVEPFLQEPYLWPLSKPLRKERPPKKSLTPARKSRNTFAPIIVSPVTTPKYLTIRFPSTEGVVVINIAIDLFVIYPITNIAKGESRGKQKSHFRLAYPEPQLIFVLTKIVKGASSTNILVLFYRVTFYIAITKSKRHSPERKSSAFRNKDAPISFL